MYTRFMMYVLRRLSLAAILLSILFLISGCAQAIIHISINPDGSSSVEYQLGLTQNLLALSPGGVNPLQKAADDARKDGFTVTDYQEGSYAGFRAKRLFKPGEKGLRLTDLIKIPELAAGRGPAVESKQPLTVKNELFTSTISLDTELDLTNMGQAIQDQGQVQSREQGQDQSQSPRQGQPSDPFGIGKAIGDAMLKNLDLRFQLTLPVEPEYHNATTVSENGRKLEWKLIPGQVNTIQASVKLVRKDKIFGIIVLAAIILAVLTIRRRRRRRRSAALPSTVLLTAALATMLLLAVILAAGCGAKDAPKSKAPAGAPAAPAAPGKDGEPQPAPESAPGSTPPGPGSAPGSTPAPAPAPNLSPAPSPAPAPEIIIGIEYASPGMAKTFSDLGIPAVKYYPDHYAWGKMQPSPQARVNFALSDTYVREYQEAGFRNLVIALKPNSTWAVKDPRKNLSPKPEYLPAYEAWVRSMVERYDLDGDQDMPGLKAPVRYFEIGVEFSSYEPEPVGDYLEVLGRAYKAAHAASDQAVVMHAAFLTTTAFKDHPAPDRYPEAFGAVDKRIMEHSLDDIRKILDRPDLFDALNFHSLGDPYEIRDIVNWLDNEMKTRGYRKPMIISDTGISPLIAWGPATTCRGLPAGLGLIIPPATEQDRCRLAAYFQKLVNGDQAAIEWTYAFAASDVVKRVTIAAEQGVVLINTAFMEEFAPAKAKLFRAATGTAAWGAMSVTAISGAGGLREVTELRPPFYALKQLAAFLKGYRSIEWLPQPDSRIRINLFRIVKAHGQPSWIAWVEPNAVVLPGETVPGAKLVLQVGGPSVQGGGLAQEGGSAQDGNPGQGSGQAASVTVAQLITRVGQTEPEQLSVPVKGGTAEIDLTPTPVFITLK